MQYDGLLLAPIFYPGGERLECRQFAQSIASVRYFKRRDMNESHSVLELKGSIVEAGRFLALELIEHSGDVALVLRRAIRFDFVSHHYLLHDLAPFVFAY